MMASIIREAPFGQIVRWLSRNKFLKYPEEEEDFECPECYRDPEPAAFQSNDKERASDLGPSDLLDKTNNEKPLTGDAITLQTQSESTSESDLEKLGERETSTSGIYDKDATKPIPDDVRPSLTRTRTITRETTRPYTQERFNVEREEELQRNQSLPIIAQRNESGDILVDWYTTDDPANPQNWSAKKKAFVGLQIL